MVRQAEQREGRLTIMTWNAEGLRSGGGARNSDERGTVVEEHSLRRVLVDMQEQGVDVAAIQEIRQSEATVRVMVRRLQLESRWKAYEFVVASTWGRTIKQRTLALLHRDPGAGCAHRPRRCSFDDGRSHCWRCREAWRCGHVRGYPIAWLCTLGGIVDSAGVSW